MTKSAKERVSWHYCHDCQVKAGGQIPKDWVGTVESGLCDDCGEVKTLIPNMDYSWPDGRKAWFD